MLFVFASLWWASASQAQPVFTPTTDLSACTHHAPYGFPRIRLPDYTTICRSGHAIMYDNQARLPTWSIHMLQQSHVTACGITRPDRFFPDPLVPARARVTSASFRASGWDQGHLVSNANQMWHPQVQTESFFLTNVAPQHPSLNRRLWRTLESEVRNWVYAQGDHVIITGVIYHHTSPRLGFHEILIPSDFYKIITHVESGRTWAFRAENTVTDHNRVDRIQTTVHDISRATGIQFAQPDNPRLMRELPRVASSHLRNTRRLECAAN